MGTPRRNAFATSTSAPTIWARFRDPCWTASTCKSRSSLLISTRCPAKTPANPLPPSVSASSPSLPCRSAASETNPLSTATPRWPCRYCINTPSPTPSDWKSWRMPWTAWTCPQGPPHPHLLGLQRRRHPHRHRRHLHQPQGQPDLHLVQIRQKTLYPPRPQITQAIPTLERLVNVLRATGLENLTSNPQSAPPMFKILHFNIICLSL